MGIRFLNRYIKQYGFKGIFTKPVSFLAGKKIVVDTSIFMYRFKSAGSLLKSMDALLRMFLQHRIIPLFVFDGPPRSNKKELLKERQKMKQEAWDTYKSATDLSEHQIVRLKNTFTKVSKKDVEDVKELMDQLGISYLDAPHESDEVCASLVVNGKMYACMSDDMDMFMYGCPRVIRDVNVSEQTMVCYDTYSILKQLGFTLHEFKQIGVLSGSEYYKSSYTLYTVVSMFHAFKRTEHTDFYEWVNLHHSIEVDRLREAYHAFTPQLEQPSGSDD